MKAARDTAVRDTDAGSGDAMDDAVKLLMTVIVLPVLGFVAAVIMGVALACALVEVVVGLPVSAVLAIFTKIDGTAIVRHAFGVLEQAGKATRQFFGKTLSNIWD
ncbi:hypothetical protein [Streptomyces sp. NPDC003077]|uniref:hypothetical protein n=1 Tax=Streptomyces sp. NPDC003077 TaxID=3154443 RepID=UPI0033A1B3AF